MAKLGGTFDAKTVEPNAPLEALPAGEYRVQILQSEMRATKAGTGRMLWLDMEVLDGEHKGRHLYDQLNLINPNPTAEEIAQRTLSAICHATGRLEVSDSDELHFAPMLAKVVVKPNGYNEIKGYKATGEKPTPPAKPPAFAVVPARAAPEGDKGPAPWKHG
jgi:hypothetical protein